MVCTDVLDCADATIPSNLPALGTCFGLKDGQSISGEDSSDIMRMAVEPSLSELAFWMEIETGCNEEFKPQARHQSAEFLLVENCPERSLDPTNCAKIDSLEGKAVAYTDCVNFNRSGFTPSFTYAMPFPQRDSSGTTKANND
mmetsp:Transcript_43928/g.91977  ORF Transcript_43928/g.91977 Transcript_43928/m.91977 type:complete len:143 (-) Transcript_43928:344-772(-)